MVCAARGPRKPVRSYASSARIAHPIPQDAAAMAKLDHLTLPVKQCVHSREWYLAHLGLKVEFEVPERRTVALEDDSGFTMFLVEAPAESFTASCTLAFQVEDVEATHRALSARGVIFEKSPAENSSGATARSSATPTVISSTCGMSEACRPTAEAPRPRPQVDT